MVIGRNFILPAQEVDIAHRSAAGLAVHRLSEAASGQAPYLLIGLVVLAWALLIRLAPFPTVATTRHADGLDESPQAFGSVLRLPRVRFGVVAQFFYVGAQVGIWSFLIRYVEPAMRVRPPGRAPPI